MYRRGTDFCLLARNRRLPKSREETSSMKTPMIALLGVIGVLLLVLAVAVPASADDGSDSSDDVETTPLGGCPDGGGWRLITTDETDDYTAATVDLRGNNDGYVCVSEPGRSLTQLERTFGWRLIYIDNRTPMNEGIGECTFDSCTLV